MNDFEMPVHPDFNQPNSDQQDSVNKPNTVDQVNNSEAEPNVEEPELEEKTETQNNAEPERNPEKTEPELNFEQQKLEIPHVDFDKVDFVQKDGRTYMPSLIRPEDEDNFEIKRDFYMNGYIVLSDSVHRIRTYEIADQYLNVFQQMDQRDFYWLKFIARFKSVQSLQLINQTHLSSGIFSKFQMWSSLNKLQRLGLIQKWKYFHPIVNKNIHVFTLTVNGFRFLETFWGDQKYFQPQNFYRLNPLFHVRFWETCDVYQVLSTLPAFKGYTTMFNGYPKQDIPLVPSPLQISIELIPNTLENLVFYTCLQTDSISYYQDVVTKWSKFTDEGQNFTRPVADLPAGKNILAFYCPTLECGNNLSQQLNLANWNFTSIFLIGTFIKTKGIQNAFFLPQGDKNELCQLKFDNLLKKDQKSSENNDSQKEQ